MSKIKFRAWHKNTKKMLRVIAINFDLNNITADIENRKIYKDIDYWWKETDIPFSEIILLQSTGLKDKNCVEIYEGDILNIYQYGHVVAEFAEGCYGAWDYYGFAPFRGTLFGCGGEIIGNIYENPELLEEITGIDVGDDIYE